MPNRYTAAALAAVLGASIALAGCSAQKPGTPAQKLTVKGSDTMVQLAQAWAQEFMKTHPDVQVSVTGGGSNTGISALMNKGTDVANASRPIMSSERELARTKGLDVKEFVVAQDGLSVIVNPRNPITHLTLAQLKGIYTGALKNWREIGGPEARIVLNARETSSGTYVFFQEHVLGKGTPYADTAMLQPSTSQIVQNVADDLGGIGYVGLGYVTDQVKAIPVQKDDASEPVAATVANVVNGSYALARPLYQYTAGEPAGAVKTWLDWVLGAEGQAIVAKLDFVPIK